MLLMPVATLRVWERRYGVTRAEVSATGQRLYSADDVRRLVLLKQLVDRGHAIGSVAALDNDQLRQIASTHASAQAAHAPASGVAAMPRPGRACRVAVVGEALAERLSRPAVLHRLSRPLQLLGPFADLATAASALRASPVDLLMVQEPRLQEGWPEVLQTSFASLAATPKAVLYRFGAEASCESLAANGVALLREPQSDTALGQWLQGVLAAVAPSSAAAPSTSPPLPDLPARRWDDAALAEFATRSSTIACECPRHVAELLVQLSHFEAYSAECRNRSAADAELHGFLQRVAADSRALFEAALERVALHEGLLLPPPRPAAAAAARKSV